MADPLSSQSDGPDLKLVDDPNLRRILRQMQEQMAAVMDRQQAEIEALLEMLTDRHIGSLGEFKRYLNKRRQGTLRADRVHEAILEAIRPAAQRPRELQ